MTVSLHIYFGKLFNRFFVKSSADYLAFGNGIAEQVFAFVFRADFGDFVNEFNIAFKIVV